MAESIQEGRRRQLFTSTGVLIQEIILSHSVDALKLADSLAFKITAGVPLAALPPSNVTDTYPVGEDASCRSKVVTREQPLIICRTSSRRMCVVIWASSSLSLCCIESGVQTNPAKLVWDDSDEQAARSNRFAHSLQQLDFLLDGTLGST